MKNFKIKKLILPALMTCAILSAFPVSASIGKIVYGYGDNHAFDSDGNQRALKKGSEINEGDTLVTSRGRLHVRLIDGGFISVYPNSKYKIDKFKFSGKKASSVEKTPGKKDRPTQESKQDRGFFSLLKGAARQVTGLLGRTYNENFKFKTTVATIGIRGTGFFARLCQADCFDADGNPIQDGMYIKNNTGVITMHTNAGELALAQGQSAFAASSEDSPLQVVQPPVLYNTVTPDIELFDFDEKIIEPVVEEDAGVMEPGPTEPVVEPPVATITVTSLEYVASQDTSFPVTVGNIDTTNGIDTAQQTGDEITHFEGTGVTDGGLLIYDQNTAVLAESGANATLGVLWNRWGSGYTLTEGGSDLTAFGTVAGKDIHLIGSDNFTPSLAGLTGRGSVSYVNTGGTTPTIEGVAGSQTGVQTLNVTIDYASAIVTNFQLDVAFGNATMTTNLATSAFLGGTRYDPSQFINEVSLTGSCIGGGDCGANGGVVNGTATINLVGPNAEGIYGSYNLTNTENAVSGTYLATEPLVQQ